MLFVFERGFEMPVIIPPKVGRVVLFVPKSSNHENGFCINAGADHSARIAYVHVGETYVNVEAIDANGKTFNRIRVPLVQDGYAAPDEDYCHWMDYQVEQAKKSQ